MKYSYILLLLFLCSVSCSDDEEKFNRKAFLINAADNLIVPALEDYVNELQALEDDLIRLKNDPSFANIEMARNQWKNVFSSFLSISSFNFGPGDQQGLQRNLQTEWGSWPVDTTEVKRRITDLDLEMNDSRRETRGLLTLEYILFRESNDQFDDVKVSTYANTIVSNLLIRASLVLEEWETGYRDEFVNALGTDVKSSTTEMYNEWVRSILILTDLKWGLPADLIFGKSGNAGLAQNYHSNGSLTFVKQELIYLFQLWRGTKEQDESDDGWSSYVRSVSSGDRVASDINEKFIDIIDKISDLEGQFTFQELIFDNDPVVEEIFMDLRALSTLVRSEMSSVLGLAITFSSIDGD